MVTTINCIHGYREKQEAAERKLRGEDDPASDDEMPLPDGNNPFKRLNMDDLHKKVCVLV
jgi:hypothetical protein